MDTSEIDLNSPAIKALGSLFKLTEIFLLDDGFPIDDTRQVSPCPKHIRFKYDDDDDDDDDINVDYGGNISSKSSIETMEESVVMEDVDISLEMSALGLPLSFQTNKQPSSVQRGKHRTTQRKDQDSQNRIKDQILLSPNLIEESQTDAEFQDKLSNSSSLSMTDQAELSCSGFDVCNDTVRLTNSCDGEHPANVADLPRNMSCEAFIDDLLGTDLQMENKMSIAAKSNLLEKNTSCGGDILDDCIEEHPKKIDRSLMEQVDAKRDELGNGMQVDDLGSSTCIEHTQVAGMSIDSDMVLDNDTPDNSNFSAVSGEWNAFWDSYYMRYYFYNSKTEESTWYPPPGMESFVNSDVSNICNDSNTEAIGAGIDPDFSQKEEQLDRHESDDKTRFDEQTGDKEFGIQAFTSQNSSPGSAMLSDTSCAVNLYDHALDGNCQNAITSSSSLSTINHHQNPKDEREQEGSGGMSTTVSQSNNYETVTTLCENVNGNCNGNLKPQLSNASSLSSIVEAAACDDDLINHAKMGEVEKEANGIHLQDTPAATKKKAKRRNRRRKKSFSNIDDNEFQSVEEYYVDITKYWCQRYLLFSKFDVGIQMDEEGWFSVTPEAIARHHASRSGGGVIIDCFTGVGGNAIQFAKTSKHVIAIDIDPKKIIYAQHNAAIYGVEDRIDFIEGNSFSVAPKLKADTVFLSPPWGGPDYLKVKSYDINMLQPYDGQFLFDTFKATASLIIMFLPRNVDIVQLAELCLSSSTSWSLEVEKNYLNGKLKAVTAYFSRFSRESDEK